MAFSLVIHTAKAATTPTQVVTDTIDTTGCTFLVVSVGFYPGSDPNPTMDDNFFNTWNPLTAASHTSIKTRIYWSIPDTVGSGHYFELFSASNIYPSIEMTGWTGQAASPFDQENGANSGTASTISTGSVTPSENNELVIAALGHESNSSGAVSINGGFTISDAVAYGGGTNEASAQAYLIQTSAAAANPQWNITNNATDLAAVIATFKVAAAGGQPTIRRWGGVPFMGGQGIGQKGSASGSGRAWGRSTRKVA